MPNMPPGTRFSTSNTYQVRDNRSGAHFRSIKKAVSLRDSRPTDHPVVLSKATQDKTQDTKQQQSNGTIRNYETSQAQSTKETTDHLPCSTDCCTSVSAVCQITRGKKTNGYFLRRAGTAAVADNARINSWSPLCMHVCDVTCST